MATVGGIEIGAAGSVGTIYNGFVLSAGDDFAGTSPDIVNALRSTARFFDLPLAQNVGPQNSARGKGALANIDVGPYYTGVNDANRGVAPGTWQDIITQSNGFLHLGARAANSTTEYPLISLWNQHLLGSAINTAGAFVFAPPAIIEWSARVTNPNTNTGGFWHPSFWVRSMGSVNAWQGLEIDFEGNPAAGTGGGYDFNNYVWSGGSSTSNNNGSGNTIAPNMWDTSLHLHTLVFGTNSVAFYVDATLVWTITANTQPNGVNPFFGIVTNHIASAGTVSGWTSGFTGTATIDVDYIRVWRSATAAHRTPLVTPQDIYAPFGATWAEQMPDTVTTWGAALAYDKLEAVPHSSRAPGGTYQGSWGSNNALFPSSISLINNTLICTGTEQPGRIYFVRAGVNQGDTCAPQRFVANIGPRVLTPAAGINSASGATVAYDLYRDMDVGDLLPMSLSITSLPSGLSMPLVGPNIGRITGTQSGTGTIAGTVTNAVGQSVAFAIPVAPATAGAGTAAPVFPNFANLQAAGLVAALDFDADSSITTGTGIASITGAWGTSYAATQATGSAQPTRATLANNKKAARFTAASSQLLDWSALVSGAPATFSGAHTIVMVAKHASNTAMVLFDACQVAGSTTAQRSSLLFSTSGGKTFRHGGSATSDAADGVTTADTVNNRLWMGRRFTQSSSQGMLHLDKAAQPYGAPGVSGMSVNADTITIGARKSAGTTVDLYFDGWVFCILIFNRYIEEYERNIIAAWASANYGTP